MSGTRPQGSTSQMLANMQILDIRDRSYAEEIALQNNTTQQRLDDIGASVGRFMIVAAAAFFTYVLAKECNANQAPTNTPSLNR